LKNSVATIDPHNSTVIILAEQKEKNFEVHRIECSSSDEATDWLDLVKSASTPQSKTVSHVLVID
jgi:hypothetical protein